MGSTSANEWLGQGKWSRAVRLGSIEDPHIRSWKARKIRSEYCRTYPFEVIIYGSATGKGFSNTLLTKKLELRRKNLQLSSHADFTG